MSVNYCTGEELERPWGKWQVLDTGDRYAVKRLVIKPSHGISLQVHMHRDEHWIVTSGKGLLTLRDQKQQISANDHVFIAAGEYHQAINSGQENLVMVEIQVGETLDETDIIRREP